MTDAQQDTTKAMLVCDQCGATSPGKEGDKCPKCEKGKLVAKKPKDEEDKNKSSAGSKDAAEGGKLQAGLTSLVERATSALNQVKAGKIGAPVFAALAAMERDVKALREKYPSPKAAREFTKAEFDAWVAEETAEIMREKDSSWSKFRTASLGESIAEFNKQVAKLPSNAQDKDKVKINIFRDPDQKEQAGPKTVPHGGGSAGLPTHALKTEDGNAAPPAGDSGTAPPPEQIGDDPMDDGKWEMDMGGTADHPDPLVAFGKRRAEESKSVGVIGDLNSESTDSDQQ